MNRQKLVYPLLLLLCSCASAPKPVADPGSPTRPGEHQIVPLVGTTKVHRFELENGLRLLVVEDHSSPTFAYQTWVRVGSRDEVKGRTGLAHLFEHMMFKGTPTHPEGELGRILDGAGAEGTNAFTTKDYTVYVTELPTKWMPEGGAEPKDSLDLIMGIESDRLVNTTVNDQSFKTELEVVQNERRMRYENNPDGLSYQMLLDTAFTLHPYHWPVIGYEEDLNHMTAEDARQFYKTYYSPNHATVIVSGDVNPEEVYAKAKQYYGGLSPTATPAHEIPQEPAQTAPRRKEMKMSVQVDKVLLAYHIPDVSNADIPALAMLQNVLSGGRSSRLHRALVETGIATGVDADEEDDKDPTLFVIAAGLQKGRKAAIAESVILKELQRVAREPISQGELERARSRMSFGFLDGLETNSERCHFLGHYETIAGNASYGIDLYNKTLAVTPAEVQAAAKKYLDSKMRTSVTVVPK
jgi:zinc protease